MGNEERAFISMMWGNVEVTSEFYETMDFLEAVEIHESKRNWISTTDTISGTFTCESEGNIMDLLEELVPKDFIIGVDNREGDYKIIYKSKYGSTMTIDDIDIKYDTYSINNKNNYEIYFNSNNFIDNI